jgi:hypothetical protein
MGGWFLPMLWADGEWRCYPSAPDSSLPPHLDGEWQQAEDHGVWDRIDFDFQFLLMFLLGGESRGVGERGGGQIDAMGMRPPSSPSPELMAHFRSIAFVANRAGGVERASPLFLFPISLNPSFAFAPSPLIRVIPVPPFHSSIDTQHLVGAEFVFSPQFSQPFSNFLLFSHFLPILAQQRTITIPPSQQNNQSFLRINSSNLNLND